VSVVALPYYYTSYDNQENFEIRKRYLGYGFAYCQFSTFSRSSIEEEYKAHANTTTGIMWIQTLLGELKLAKYAATTLWRDNLGVTYLSVNLVFHARIKHIEIDYHFVRERVARKQLNIQFISTNDQLTNEFMKTLSMSKMISFQHGLNLGQRLQLKGSVRHYYKQAQ
jgi:hypothetical protein